MGTTRIYFVAGVLLFVLNGVCLVKGTNTTTTTNTTMAPGNSTDGNSTSDDNSTSGMNSGTTMAPVPADNSTSSNNPDSGITCLICLGDNSSNCNHASPTSDMEDIIEQSGCRSCRILKSDTGKGTDITQIVRVCNQNDSCPADLMDEEDFKCFDNNNQRTCEWCCEDDNCNNFNRNSADALVAAVVLGSWTITKVVYVVVSAIAVAISMSTMA